MRATTLALLLLAGAPVALAQQDPPKQEPPKPTGEVHRLPFNPFTEAAEGDWMVFQLKVVAGPNEMLNTIACRVSKVTADEVTLISAPLDADTASEGIEDQQQTFPRKEAPELARFVFDDPDLIVSDLKQTEEARDLGEGKKLDCKVLAFTVPDPGEPEARLNVRVWVSPQVKANGLVSAEIRGGSITMDSKLLGWGTAKETGWGKTPEQIKADLAKAAPPPEKAPPEKGQ